MRTDNDLTLGPMSIRGMFKAQSELLQLTELYTPLGAVLSPSDTSVRPVRQRVDPESKAHHSRYENTVPRGKEASRLPAPIEAKHSTGHWAQRGEDCDCLLFDLFSTFTHTSALIPPVSV